MIKQKSIDYQEVEKSNKQNEIEENTINQENEIEESIFKKSEEYIKKNGTDVPDEVVALAEERLLAKQQKDWAKADELRGKIKEMGYSVLDSKEGYELKKL